MTASSLISRLVTPSLAVAGFLLLASEAPAREWFVGKAGNDGNSGLNKNEAFLTIGKGLAEMSAGDTLTLGPGEYAEAVQRQDLGDAEHETIIRAELPGTALLRGDVAMPPLEKVKGLRFVYSAAVEEKPVAVLEVDTLHNLSERFGKIAPEFEPGTWYYDEAEKRVYLSSSDLEVPTADHFRISVTPVSGMILENPQRVNVEGLAFTGFFPAEKKKHPYFNYVGGLMLLEPRACTVRNVTAYLNGQGICLVGGQDTIIEDCIAYGNGSPYHDQGGNIVQYQPNEAVIRNNLSYGSSKESIKMYSGFAGPTLLQGNVSWGAWADYYIKGGDNEFVTKQSLGDGNVGFSVSSVLNVKRNLFGGVNHYNRDMTPDNVMLPGLDRSREFADFLNLDFRLQADSTLRGSGPEGTDRGPYPYVANVFYVAADGADTNAGDAISRPWKTLAHGFKKLQAGETLYLSTGTYEVPAQWKAPGEKGKPVVLRGRGSDRVFLKGAITVQGGETQWERLVFLDPVQTDNSAVTFAQCQFLGRTTGLSVKGGAQSRVTHCEFVGFDEAGLRVEGSDPLFLAGNIFANQKAPAVVCANPKEIRYSDYNSYARADGVWQLGGKPESLPDLQKVSDSHSRIIVPEFVAADPGLTLVNRVAFSSRGPLGKPLGNYPTFPVRPARLEGPFLHSVTDTTANLEWWTPQMAHCQITWGHSPETMQTRWVFTAGYGGMTLTGLEPGKSYAFKILQVDPTKDVVPFRNFYLEGFDENLIGSKKFITYLPEKFPQATVAFETLKTAPEAKTYYVSKEGSDADDGFSVQTAWATISHAASQVQAGDTVQIGAGEYAETVWMRAGGDKDRLIRFQPVPGAHVVLHGDNGRLNNGMILRGRSFVGIDGIRFQGFGFGGEIYPSSLQLYESNDVQITRCFMDGRTITYSVPFIDAWACRDLLIKNCVIMQAMNSGMFLTRCPDARIEHCVFFRNYTGHAAVVNKADEKVHFDSCIFTDLTVGKEKVRLLELPMNEAFSQANNVFFLRTQGEERAAVFDFYKSVGRLKLPEYFAQFGAQESVEGDPGFVGMEGLKSVGKSSYPPDQLIQKRPLDFADFFITNPEMVKKGVGLQKSAFAEFENLKSEEAKP